jgi:hypothetical protein
MRAFSVHLTSPQQRRDPALLASQEASEYHQVNDDIRLHSVSHRCVLQRVAS